MDGQKRIRRHQHHWQKQPKLRQRKHRDEQPNADDGQVPELPEPERGFGVQVIGVNVNTITSMNEKAPPQNILRRRWVVILLFAAAPLLAPAHAPDRRSGWHSSARFPGFRFY